MTRKKQLRELTIKDNFMFAAVMMEEENCRKFLEITLGFPIDHVEVSREKSIVYHPEYKGIRLDVYARDENRTHYNVEMQVTRKPALGKRVRYYHGQIDMELLLSGSGYAELPDAYVIFICDFDPFGKRKYRYTFERRCLEDAELGLDEGSRSIFLSTCGENESEVPKELVKFLRFVKADLSGSEEDFEDDYVKELQETVRRIKGSREMEERFMILEEMLKEERAEGLAEGLTKGRTEGKSLDIIELLQYCEPVPEALQDRILGEKDPKTLKKWLKLAANVNSVEKFQKNM